MRRQLKNRLTFRLTLILLAVILVSSTLIQITSHSVHATSVSELQSQIDQLEQEKSQYNAEIVRLSGEAQTLQNTLAQFASQKAAIQSQIDISQAKYDQLLIQISETEQKIKDDQDALGTTLANLYVDGQVTPIEMIASSKNVGDYLDKQEYRTSIRNELSTKIASIKALKKELDAQEVSSRIALDEQKQQRQQLADKEAETQQLIDYTKGQEAAYSGYVAANKVEIDKKRAEQVALILAEQGAQENISSGYPYMDKGIDTDDGCRYPDGGRGWDEWGYCYRNCTSYVAWKLANDGRNNSGFAYLGNAKYWGYGGNQIAADPSDLSDLQRGDVIIKRYGAYGHVMYVELVSGDTITFTQMNSDWQGNVSQSTMSVSWLSNSIANGGYAVRRFH